MLCYNPGFAQWTYGMCAADALWGFSHAPAVKRARESITARAFVSRQPPWDPRQSGSLQCFMPVWRSSSREESPRFTALRFNSSWPSHPRDLVHAAAASGCAKSAEQEKKQPPPIKWFIKTQLSSEQWRPLRQGWVFSTSVSILYLFTPYVTFYLNMYYILTLERLYNMLYLMFGMS